MSKYLNAFWDWLWWGYEFKTKQCGGLISEFQYPNYGSILVIPRERLKCLIRS